MAKIEKLTAEQVAYLPKFRAEYLARGTNCDPADRPRAERAFARAYKVIGKERVPVIWVDSPLSAQLAFAALKHLALPAAKGGGSKFLKLADQLAHQLRGQLRGQLAHQLRGQLRGQLAHQLWGQLADQIAHQLAHQLWGQIAHQLADQLAHQLRGQLRGQLENSKIEFQDTYWLGQQDLYWIAFYKFCADIGVKYPPDTADRLDIMHEIGHSCMWWYPRDGLIIACERPLSVSFDEIGRLHNDTGPAIAFRDGWKLYAVHGVRLDGWIIEQSERLDIKTIEAEPNTEIQRVMIERFGWDRYADECGASIIDHDEKYGTLYGRNGRAEFLKVINGSPEPDGSFRRYILPVAPSCEPLPDEGGELGDAQILTALNAVASTYGLTGAEYRKVMEVRT